MKKTLYTIGDSWTQGYDLKNPKEECYPYLLSKKLDCDLINEAKPAASNDWMFRKSVEWITTNDTSNIHTFIVGWSQPDRREENFNFYHGGAPKYERINYPDNPISNWISDNLSNEKLSNIKSFTYIYTLQEILKKNNINYLFYFPWDPILLQDDWYEENIKEYVHDIYLSIDLDYCVGTEFDGETPVPIDELRHPTDVEQTWICNKLYGELSK